MGDSFDERDTLLRERKEISQLRREVAEFLQANMETLVLDVHRALESSLEEEGSLSPTFISEMRKSFRDFYQLYVDYFEARDFPEKYIESFASDVGSIQSRQGVRLSSVLKSFEAGELRIWNAIAEALLPRGYSAKAWIELGRHRDEFTKKVREYLQKSFLHEERSSIEKQIQELKALFDLGQTIVSTVELENVLSQVLEVAISLMQARMGVILLVDETGRYLEPAADIGLSRSWVQREKLRLTKSLGGVAIKRGEYVYAKDDELEVFELPKAQAGKKIRSALSVPISVDGEPIGVIEIYETTPRLYTELDISLLMTFGTQAGVAIKNARLFKEERRRRLQANVLSEIAQATAEAQDLDGLVRAITEKTADALGVDRCSLFVYDPEADTLTFVGGWGRSTLHIWMLSQFHLPMSEITEASARAIRTKKGVVSSEEDEKTIEVRIFGGHSIRSCLRVPLYVKDELIGLLRAEFTGSEGDFTDDDIRLAEAIGRHAAVAIQNRRLQEKVFEQQLTVRNAEINERLYREREKSEAVLKATPDAVFLINRERKVVFVNPAAEFLTGWSTDEAKEKSCHEILHGAQEAPAECPNPNCAIFRVLKGEHVAFSEDEITTRSGRRVPVGGTFAPTYGQDGKIETVVAIYRDISEQKELEKYALFQREMDIASGIQSSLLPRGPLEVGGVSIHAKQQQARMVGGDWYDYWTFGDKIFIVVGDASGSGVGAALFATMAMSAIRVEARDHNRILDILEHVNTGLYNSNRSESFVTLFFGVIDLRTMTISYSNAGHEEPIILVPGEHTFETLSSASRSLLGIFERPDLDVRRYSFRGGERLVVFTDGLIDAQNRKGKVYGLKRLLRFVSIGRDMEASSFIDALVDDVLNFTGGELKDDVTVLVCDIPIP